MYVDKRATTWGTYNQVPSKQLATIHHEHGKMDTLLFVVPSFQCTNYLHVHIIKDNKGSSVHNYNFISTTKRRRYQWPPMANQSEIILLDNNHFKTPLSTQTSQTLSKECLHRLYLTVTRVCVPCFAYNCLAIQPTIHPTTWLLGHSALCFPENWQNIVAPHTMSSRHPNIYFIFPDCFIRSSFSYNSARKQHTHTPTHPHTHTHTHTHPPTHTHPHTHYGHKKFSL